MFPLVYFIIFGFSLGCRLDSSLHGFYKRQSSSLGKLVFDNNSIREPIVFDDLTITATAISEYGECYAKSADAYIFALKRMGRAPCFRCITPIIKTPNIIQLAHQQEDICYETADEAKATCFDSNLVSSSDGYLAFRSENMEPASCGVSGRFSVGYQLRGGDLTCSPGEGSTASSCDEDSSIFSVSFKNCSFPDFTMGLRCVGSWKEKDGRQLVMFLNEENGEYRCGTFEDTPPEGKLHLANDSSCGRLSPINAFETYLLKSETVPATPTSCSFPDWLHGKYDSLTINSDVLKYEGPGAAPVLSKCVHVDGERIIVHSRTKCGEELGFHCLWFRARSDNLIEFKTTIPSDAYNETSCIQSGELSAAPWTTALVKEPIPIGCGIKGLYTTPQELRSRDCFNVSVDCAKGDALRVAAYDCKSGTVYDSRTYGCVASWRDEDQLFIYSTRSQDTHSCFVLRYEGGRLFFASTGAHCGRGFNFTDNADKTIILQENGGCTVPTSAVVTTSKPKPARKPSYHVYRRPPTPMVIATSTKVTLYETTQSEFLTDGSSNLKNILASIICLLFLRLL